MASLRLFLILSLFACSSCANQPSAPAIVTVPATGATSNPISPVTPTVTSPGGQSWCVAKSGLSQTSLQTALDYACGLGGVDCSAIKQGGLCYNPITLQNHASFAFNTYYQKNPALTSCDFGGAATVTNQNPSTGSCVYPTIAIGTGAPPNVLNSTSTKNPPLGGTSTGGIVGASPPADGSYTSLSNHLQAVVGLISVVPSITTYYCIN